MPLRTTTPTTPLSESMIAEIMTASPLPRSIEQSINMINDPVSPAQKCKGTNSDEQTPADFYPLPSRTRPTHPLSPSRRSNRFLALDGAPLHERASQKSQRADDDGQDEGAPEGDVVGVKHARQLGGRRDGAHLGLARMNDEGGVDLARGVFGDLLDEGVDEDVLGNADAEGAAEGVEEDGNGVYEKGTCQPGTGKEAHEGLSAHFRSACPWR